MISAALVMLAGCGRRQEREGTGKIPSHIAERTIRAYSALHPLRCSRLGLHGADSLLFTFSDSEIVVALDTLNNLLEDVSSMPAADLERRQLDASEVIINWLRGEIFAISQLRLYRRNPLLYCWIVKEALYGGFCRNDPPYSGEFQAYEKRLSRIPELLRNAARLLDKPAEAHIYTAERRLRSLLDGFDSVRRLSAERYAAQPAPIDSVRASIEIFLRFVSIDLRDGTRGSLLLGTENLSRIFQYDDLLDIDPNRMTSEADRLVQMLRKEHESTEIRRAARQSAAVQEQNQRRADTADGRRGNDRESLLRSLIDEIDEASAGSGIFEADRGKQIEISLTSSEHCRAPLPPNPYLSIPRADGPSLRLESPFLFGERDCPAVLVAREDFESMEGTALTYEIMKVSAHVREGITCPCDSANAIVSLLPSGTWNMCWLYLNLADLVDLIPDPSDDIHLRLIEEKIRALAIMSVVFRLHAGTYTSENAAAYLTEMAGMNAPEAAAAVLAASSSPRAAYPGLAIILTDDMIKRLSTIKGLRNPRKELRKLLLENCGLPLTSIRDRIQVD
jgi:hypothetical protein